MHQLSTVVDINGKDDIFHVWICRDMMLGYINTDEEHIIHCN